MQPAIKILKAHGFTIVVSASVLAAYYALFIPYLPNSRGGLGHDYKYQFPNLLAGYYWYQNNGLFSIPWFTPSQCGGIPFYGDAGHGLYSLPQLLVLVINPLSAIKLTFFLFGIGGYLGFFLLLRKKFQLDQALALLGATLFLFNGFYAHRMLIGHPFHAFMLLPYLAMLLLPDLAQVDFRKHVYAVAGAGALIAYMFHSAMVHLIPPVALSVAVILLIHSWMHGWQKTAWLRFAGAVIFGVALCSSKLLASTSFLAHFPRDYYPLPGFPNVLNEFIVLGQSLFFRPPTDLTATPIANSLFALERHELEFGVTPLPLVIMVVALLSYVILLIRNKQNVIPGRRTLAYLSVIALLLSIPLILNFYVPFWNSILKSIPVFKNSSLLLRWFAAYIGVVIIVAMLLLNVSSFVKRHAHWFAIAGMLFVIAYHFTEDREFYQRQKYDSSRIVRTYEKSKSSGDIVPIQGIAVKDDTIPRHAAAENDLMTNGLSQLQCYNPIFGYRLEQFPKGDLRPGPALEITGDHFNIKNPSCYQFPKENNCRPGDHFKVAQRLEAEKFLQYRPFTFQKPFLQYSADVLNVVSVMLLLAIVVHAGINRRSRAGGHDPTARASARKARQKPPARKK